MQINLLPAHPSVGWKSIDRYWLEIENHMRRTPNLSINSPLGAPPETSKMASYFKRGISKYVIYPLLCKLSVRSGVVHLLDHSFAYLLPFIPEKLPLVVTLHDLTPFHISEGMSSAQVERFRKTCLRLHRADLVFCVSRATLEDARTILNLPEEKLMVHPMGVNYEFFSGKAPLSRESKLPEKKLKIFSVGSRLLRKNLGILPSILKELFALGEEPLLLRAGTLLPQGLKEEIQSIVGEKGLIEFGKVDDLKLRELYQQADVFIMPSKLEGFGLPVIEAMAAGCPVVCSTGGSLPEAAGGAALLFDPDDAEQAAQHIHNITTNAGLRKELQDKGKQHAKSLSWENHARRLIEVYRQLSIQNKI